MPDRKKRTVKLKRMWGVFDMNGELKHDPFSREVDANHATDAGDSVKRVTVSWTLPPSKRKGRK